MIIPLKGNIKYPITLDASVWIFDDRKIILDEALSGEVNQDSKEDELVKASEIFNQTIYQQKVKPPVNKSINRFEREKILTNSYVMPIHDFLEHAEIQNDASKAILKTDEIDVIIPLEQLKDAYFLFALNGKPLKENGPAHVYFKDGSNKDNPIKGVKGITIK